MKRESLWQQVIQKGQEGIPQLSEIVADGIKQFFSSGKGSQQTSNRIGNKKNDKHGSGERADLVRPPTLPDEMAKRDQIEEYIALRCLRERQRAEAPWRSCFERNAPMCQQLLGLAREPGSVLPKRVANAIRDSYALTEDGFDVQSLPAQPVDEIQLRQRCGNLTAQELEGSIALLRQELYDIPLDYQALVTALGDALGQIRGALEKDAAALPAALKRLDGALRAQGVLALFSDDEEISGNHELQLRCFSAAEENQIEIPGLFYVNRAGKLNCIGRFGGTKHGGTHL